MFTAVINPCFWFVTELLLARGRRDGNISSHGTRQYVLLLLWGLAAALLWRAQRGFRVHRRAAPPLKGPPGPNLDRFFFVTRPFPLMRQIMHLEGVGPRSGANRPVVYWQTSGKKITRASPHPHRALHAGCWDDPVGSFDVSCTLSGDR